MGGVYDDGRRDDDRGYPGEREENLARSARYRAEAEAEEKRCREVSDPAERARAAEEIRAWLRRNS